MPPTTPEVTKFCCTDEASWIPVPAKISEVLSESPPVMPNVYAGAPAENEIVPTELAVPAVNATAGTKDVPKVAVLVAPGTVVTVDQLPGLFQTPAAKPVHVAFWAWLGAGVIAIQSARVEALSNSADLSKQRAPACHCDNVHVRMARIR